jgi:hypothetical protein
MQVKLQFLVPISFLMLLSGCAGFQGYPAMPGIYNGVDNSLTTRDPWYAKSLKDYENSADQKKARNNIVQTRMAEIDIVYQDFEASLYKGNVKANVYTEWAVLALTAGATASAVEETKTALAALAAGLVGGKAAYDKNALFERTMPALISQMRAKRNEVKANIFLRMQLPVDIYGIYMAKADLDDYYIAGSIPGAIADLTASAGTALQDSEKKLQNLVVTSSFVETNTTNRINNWIDANEGNRALLREWLDDNKIEISPTFFANSELHEELRKRAIKDLSIPDS